MNQKKAKHLRRLYQNHINKEAQAKGIYQELQIHKGSFRRFKNLIQALPHPEQKRIGI